MSFICIDCGKLFEDGQQARWSESRGEFWGIPCRETVTGCPSCKGSYVEAKFCRICGSVHADEDELRGGVCEDCIDKYRYNAEVLYKVGKNDTERVEINSFLATIFTPKEINDILHREMQVIAKYALVNGSDFIESDAEWFGEMLEKEVKKDENAKG
jgi:hypothetical protein